MRRKINKWNKLFNSKNLDLKKVQLSFNSWKAHCSHANSYNLVKKDFKL